MFAAGVTVAGVLAGAGAVTATTADDDAPLTGETRDKAVGAAVAHVGGGEVTETELGDDGAAYGVEVRRLDGAQVEVNLDRNYTVTNTEVDDDAPLTGETRDRAVAAAVAHVGGGEVTETELGDDGAAYGIEVRRPDGTQVEVNLDRNYTVTSTEVDDDRGDDD
jgi:uncharacterized membrane protein YkoI